MNTYAVMLLAAGRGMRMRPLSDARPKPLLSLNGTSLIELHLRRLANFCKRVVINVAYKREQIMDYLGDGSRYGLRIVYSDEGDQPLETAGGIHHALPLLEGDTVLAINADLYTDWQARKQPIPEGCRAHAVLVDNPADCQGGDFYYRDGRIVSEYGTRLTFSGIAYYRRELFERLPEHCCKLSSLLRQAAHDEQLSAEHYRGLWINVGDAEQLARARRHHQGRSQ